jgi:hypothetical protein
MRESSVHHLTINQPPNPQPPGGGGWDEGGVQEGDVCSLQMLASED